MKSKTAAALLAELRANPEWVKRRADTDRVLAERAAICDADELELVNEIRAVGYDIDSVYDLINNTPQPVLVRRFLGPYPAAYSILVRHLSLPHVPKIREGIVRALTVKDGGRAVEDALLAAFESEVIPHLRWVIANALRTAMPSHRRKKYPEIAAALRWPG